MEDKKKNKWGICSDRVRAILFCISFWAIALVIVLAPEKDKFENINKHPADFPDEIPEDP